MHTAETTWMLNFWSIFLLFGALNGVLLAAIFFRKGWNTNIGNHLFASFLAAVSYILFIEFLHEAETLYYVPHFLATSTPVIYLLGPLFYLYAASIFDKNFKLHWNMLGHFVPFFICILTIIPFYLQPADFKIRYIQQSNMGPVNLPYTRAIYYGVALLQNVLYWWLCNRKITSQKDRIKSYIRRWLSKATLVYGGFLIGYVSVFCLFLLTDFYLREIRYGGYLLLSFSVHLYGYLLLKESLPVDKLRPAHKYMNSSLSPEEIERMKRRLLDLFEHEKPHLKSDLKIDDLAKQLQTSPHHLSQLINTEFDFNFNQFINYYRVREAKELLQSGQYDDYSLEGIAMESGFNNRTSFYRVFKQNTGTTPAEFKKSSAGL